MPLLGGHSSPKNGDRESTAMPLLQIVSRPRKANCGHQPGAAEGPEDLERQVRVARLAARRPSPTSRAAQQLEQRGLRGRFAPQGP